MEPEVKFVYFSEDGDICAATSDGQLDWSKEHTEAVWPKGHGVYRLTYERVRDYPKYEND